MTAKNLFKKLLPPIIIEFGKKLYPIHDCRWSNSPSWEEAKKRSKGYSSQEILEKVYTATLLVKNGQAACERDSVTFQSIQYSWPMLAGLMYAAAKSGGELNLIDFGGSLGSTYYQSRRFLETLKSVRWHVVEQPHFVKRGCEFFEDNILRFNNTIEEAINQNKKINTFLFSSVLQYLSDPTETISQAFSHKTNHIIIDRTSFTSDHADNITVQHVPKWIYKASYPCRFFSYDNFARHIEENGFRLIESFQSIDGFIDDQHFWKGMIFERIS